ALADRHQQMRFHREARATARLHHTNIVPVYGVGQHEGLHYYVMQFIQGAALDQVLAELKRLRKAKSTATATRATPRPASPPTTDDRPGRDDAPAADVARSLLTGTFQPAGAPEPQGSGNGPRGSSSDPPATLTEPARPGAPASPVALPGQTGPATLADSG